MKVAIWGSYNFGNFGDDLMALIFAKHCQTLGVTPCVFRLDHNLAKTYSIETTDSISKLFEQAAFCIIGGGGLLSSGIAHLDVEWRELISAATKAKCKIHMLSVGGDGTGIVDNLSCGQKDFLASKTLGASTVRLPNDTKILQAFGKEVNYYPDVLLASERLLSTKPNFQEQNIHVGLNLENTISTDFFMYALQISSIFNPNVHFYFIHSHLPNYSVNYEYLPRFKSSRIKTYEYKDPIEMLEFLSTLDELISIKLHLGVTALAFGVPFYSLGGIKKTESFLRDINSSKAYHPLNDWSYLNLLNDFINFPSSIDKLSNNFDWHTLEEQKQKSTMHLIQLTELINHYT